MVTVLLITMVMIMTMIIVVMTDDSYGLYDDDNNDDHFFIFYSIMDDWSQPLIYLLCYLHFYPFNQLSLLYFSGAATSSLPKSRRY